jgi:hypothetical protein
MRLLLALLLTQPLAACNVTDDTGANSPAGSRSFALSGFDQVALSGSDDVEVVVGPTFSVSATGPQAVLDRLDIRVDGSSLKIGRKPSMGWHWGGKGAVIRVTMPAISGAAVAGSGDMKVDKAEGKSFSANVAGSGDLSVGAIKVDAFKAGIAGSGSSSFNGVTNTADMSILGSGSLEGRDLTATTASLSIAGSGDATLRVTGSASGSVAGSGDINITGTDKCTISKMGSGEVRCQP